MFKNYLSIAIRNLFRHQLYTAINVLGLGIGMGCLLLLNLQIMNELEYDRWIPDHERIFRLETTYHIPGKDESIRATSMLPVKSFLEHDFSEIELVARVQPSWVSITRGDSLFNEQIFFADPQILEIIGMNFLEGDPESALNEPTSIVMTKNTKEKYFGAGSAYGKTVILDGDVAYKVTGVIEDLPSETHLQYSVIAPLSAPNFYSRDYIDQDWDVASVHTYLKLRNGADPALLAASLPDFISRNVPGFTIDGEKLSGSQALELSLRPVIDIHLNSKDSRNMKTGGSIGAIKALVAISLLILTISCVNFINLTSAQLTNRWHEVAIRKICGAQRRQLIIQFLGESLLLVVLALGVGIILTEALLPFLNDFVAKSLSFDLFKQPRLIGLIIVTLCVISLAGGLFPALLVSNTKPKHVLNDDEVFNFSKVGLRGALVILQFAISVGLISMAMVVHSQTQFATSLPTGFSSTNRMVFTGIYRGPDQTPKIAENLKNMLLTKPAVLNVSGSSMVPGLSRPISAVVNQTGGNNFGQSTFSVISVGTDFFPTYGIEPASGRGFDQEFPGDVLSGPEDNSTPKSGSAVINQAAAVLLQNNSAGVLGSNLRLSFGSQDINPIEINVIGIVPDLHLRSAREIIEPQIYINNPARFDYVTVQLAGDIDAEIVAGLEEVWNQSLPDQQPNLLYQDSILTAQYNGEDQQRVMLTIAALVATLIAAMGLFGMAAYIVAQKTREIGVRKVFGASIADILKLIILQFSRPVLYANLLAWPITWYFMTVWLDQFAYRIELETSYFLIPSVAALLMAWLTTGSQAVKIACTNAAHVLRAE